MRTSKTIAGLIGPTLVAVAVAVARKHRPDRYSVGWARKLPSNQPLRIVLHLPDTQASRPEARELNAALTRYFNYRARVSSRELKELL